MSSVIDTLTTVKKVSDYVKERIDTYRRIPEKIESKERDIIIQELKAVFDPEGETYSRVVKDGKFSVAFSTAMGRGRMGVLKKVLCELYPIFYSAIIF